MDTAAQLPVSTVESGRLLCFTEPRGVRYDVPFNGRSAVRDIGTAEISRIVVAHGTYVVSLSIYYRGDGGAPIRNGPDHGTVSEIVLQHGEFITKVQGEEYDSYMDNLTFIDNKGKKWGPYGTNRGGNKFVWKMGKWLGKDVAPEMGLLYFNGSYGDEAIAHLEAVFAKYPIVPPPPEVVIYEPEATDSHSSIPAGLSQFAQTLMSPIATLHVGPNDIVFRTNEDTLCRLPFFRAALKGEFLEASNKNINMPEDEPEVVSALIQFLYDDRYTYTYKPVGMTINDQHDQKNQKNPPIELREGLFHARVYALANKYDCQRLVDAAKKSLKYVLKGLKGVDIIRLLKETYDKGWAVTEWEEDSDMKQFRQGLPVLLKQLFLSNPEEVELIVSECPALGYDLMRLLVFT